MAWDTDGSTRNSAEVASTLSFTLGNIPPKVRYERAEIRTMVEGWVQKTRDPCNQGSIRKCARNVWSIFIVVRNMFGQCTESIQVDELNDIHVVAVALFFL